MLDILWIDRVVGGSGILQRLIRNLPQLAEAALQHLEGHVCPNSCYRCLRSFRNQSVHKVLDWPDGHLPAGLVRRTVVEEGLIEGAKPFAPAEGPEWAEARAEGCESPQELRLLKAIRADGGMPEPSKQYKVYDGNRVLTRAGLRLPGLPATTADLRGRTGMALGTASAGPRQPDFQPLAGDGLPRPSLSRHRDAEHARRMRGRSGNTVKNDNGETGSGRFLPHPARMVERYEDLVPQSASLSPPEQRHAVSRRWGVPIGRLGKKTGRRA